MTAYRQPHEGVAGIDRDDLLLSLDKAALPHRDALIVMASHLHHAVLSGSSSLARQMYDRIANPRVGDLVCEVSAVYLRHRDGPDALQQRLQGLGILLEHRMEWADTDEEWEQEREKYDVDESERTHEEAWYVQYGSSAADVCRWRDAQFIALPRNLHDFD